MTGGLKKGVNVAAHTRHVVLGSAPPGKFVPDIKFIGQSALGIAFEILGE